jgi:nitrite reductase (NO-forming)
MKTRFRMSNSLSLAVMATLLALPPIAARSAAANSVESKIVATPAKLPVEKAVITTAPQVPPPIKRKTPAKVIVDLETKEVTKRLADGVDYTFWTFGGTVPGPMIRIREGDFVELNLHNHPSSKMPHNIDLHAVTGQGGGAEGSFTTPGHTSTFSFRALNPGLYIYHCATAPVGMHIANGMYGLIFVEPAKGLPKVDKEFYVVQSEFYTKGKNGEKGLQAFDMDKAIKEQPDYVVFNGAVGAIAGDNAMKANVGDKVRIFFGVGGPNIAANFHVIGEIFDNVYQEGGTNITQKNVQTTIVPPGGSAIVDFKIDIPATYLLVDHAIFRTFNKGALGMIKVEGAKNPAIYTGKQVDSVYLPEGGVVQAMPAGSPVPTATKAKTFEERQKAGKIVFEASCAACHQPTGQGVPGAFPPLAGSDFLMADKARAIHTVVHGREGEMTVNGQKYNGVMPSLGLNDEDIADVLTYVRSSWGNKGDIVTPEEVKKQR